MNEEKLESLLLDVRLKLISIKEAKEKILNAQAESQTVSDNEGEGKVCPECKSKLITEDYAKIRNKCIYCGHTWAN